MDAYLSSSFLLSLLQIVWIDIILSGDNAVVIALACRGLPERQRRIGVYAGALVAALLRIVFALIISQLLAVPLLKVVGGLILLHIAVKLVRGEEEDESSVKEQSSLPKAIWTIAVADAVMSFDNVVAVAGAARGHDELFIIGLALSVPLLVVGATLITRLIDRFPILIWFGGGLLGWVAGEMIASDRLMQQHVIEALPAALQPTLHSVAGAVGAILVVGIGALLKRKSDREVAGEQAEAVGTVEADVLNR
ncbi:TerC family protein [Methylorubrum rhodesianum]|uniref:TerC family protein n=1 Tax=Methylorubrum rhodesianum TaxID=29427 RepID=A0ABU9Z8I5_9HYPH|nr:MULTISPECIES: TerC family protein [Methylorubrum]MBY0143484.1 TerC family protein [Methylorubrum populi]MRI57075.1 TerC family protein [Methylobacterium sp. DB1607]MBB5764646.1 YjbE family integral membrane protein [Methylorubrum rhodesianum]MBI1690233.1 TerC family protein [Methylorubrum sp. DB1722]MBK3404737.1 TerC family protein [Methylorubrum rhodesianum]